MVARASRSTVVLFSPRERRLGRASDPFFLPAVAKMRPPDAVFATCRRPSGIYSFETCLALLPQLPSCGSFSTFVCCSKAT